MRILCPVCGEVLKLGERQWYCVKGHSFDVARQGYVNLLTVNQKHSKNPGDTRQMVAARKEFLDGGYYEPIVQMLVKWLRATGSGPLLDVGCGEGYYLAKVSQALPEKQCVGVDISKEAVRYAAVRNPKGLWLTATAAQLPFPDNSFSCVLCMFAMTVPEEFRRVLCSNGAFLQVLAGPDHLMGLKNIIYPEILHKEKNIHPQLPGFTRIQSQTLEFSFRVNSNRQVQNLLAMTPHYWRITKEGAQRLAQTQTLQDTAQVIFNLYTPTDLHEERDMV